MVRVICDPGDRELLSIARIPERGVYIHRGEGETVLELKDRALSSVSKQQQQATIYMEKDYEHEEKFT